MSLRTMHLQELNPHLLCVLCGGYLVDATTIVECLHSFCRSCIVKYLQTSFHCPVCDVEVHKTKPLLHIRPDRTLQDIVYKIVPGIYHEEVNRRKEFEVNQKEQSESAIEEKTNESASKNPEKEKESLPFEDPVCITLEYFRKTRNRMEKEIFPTRYLRCSSEVTVRVLKKFLITKFAIPETHITEIIRSDEILDDHLTMKEVCRIYGLYSKPFVDVQYVFLEKNESIAAPLEKPKVLEVKRKRFKKRKGNKKLLKKCLSPDAPRRLKNKNAKKATLPSSQETENTGNGDMETCPARSLEKGKKEKVVISSVDPCANVKKENLVPSQQLTSDKVNEVFNGPETMDKESDNLPIPNIDIETGVIENENEVTGFKNDTIKNPAELDVEESVFNSDINGIDSSVMVTPAVNGFIHAQSDESDNAKGIDTSVSGYTSEICLNHISAELGSSALLHGLLLESS